MLCVPTSVRSSDIHGLGLFSEGEIIEGSIVWKFNPVLDQKLDRYYLKDFNGLAARAVWHYCYINPDEPSFLVLCGDDARFMNFDEPSNTKIGPRDHSGEYLLLAARLIRPGEEITVPYDSDADATRKMSVRFNRSVA